MKRILTAVVLAPLIVYVVVWAPFWAFLAVLTAVALLCFHEFNGLVAAHDIPPPGAFGFAADVMSDSEANCGEGCGEP